MIVLKEWLWIIIELSINSSTEICDNRDINGDLKEPLQHAFKCNTPLYLHAAFCGVNPMAHAERHDCMVLSWDDRNDLGPMFLKLCMLFPHLGWVWEVFAKGVCCRRFIPFSYFWSVSRVDSWAMTQVFVSLWGCCSSDSISMTDLIYPSRIQRGPRCRERELQ